MNLKFRFGRKKVYIPVEETFKTVKAETYLTHGKIVRISTPIPPEVEIIDRYQTGYKDMVTTTIYVDPETEKYVYHVDEPAVSPLVENLYTQVRERLQSMEITVPEDITKREEVYEDYVREALKEFGYEEAYVKFPELRYYVIRDVVGWGVVDVPMKDTKVEELDYPPKGERLSVVLKHDKIPATWIDTNISLSEDEVSKLIEFMAFRTGKPISVAHPILEARTPEGYRLAANLREVSLGSSFTIRKFPEEPLSITALVKNKTMSPLLAAYLWTLVENQRFILVIGEMATGKTTVLQAITSVIPRDKKVVTIEDTPELRLSHPRWQALYTRRSIYGTEQDITLVDLARYSLRTRAQYIIIGEVRDREIQTLVQMAATGHGSLCLSADEEIFAKVNGIVKVTKIGDLVENVMRKNESVEVWSYSEQRRKFEWKKVTRAFKTPTLEWIEVTTSDNRRIKSTPDHKLAVLRDGQITYVSAKDLRPNDLLLVSDSFSPQARLNVDRVKNVVHELMETPEWSYDIEVEENHNFLVGDGILSSNCTFHASDPTSLFLRLTSPPLSVQPSFIITISAIVLQSRVWSRKYGKFIRRTSRVWEIVGVKPYTKEGEIPVIYRPVFVWDPEEDVHYPNDPEDLLKISKQVKLIGMSTYGSEWYDEILWEITEKVKFIEELVSEGVFDFKEVTERIYQKTIEMRKRDVKS